MIVHAYGLYQSCLLAYLAATANTHRRRRRDSTVELNRVGGVNAPVGSCDPVYNFLYCWAMRLVTNKWRHNDVIVENVINIYQNSRRPSQTAMESGQSPHCRPNPSAVVVHELFANCEHIADADVMQLDSWVASATRRCVSNRLTALNKRCLITLLYIVHLYRSWPWRRRKMKTRQNVTV